MVSNARRAGSTGDASDAFDAGRPLAADPFAQLVGALQSQPAASAPAPRKPRPAPTAAVAPIVDESPSAALERAERGAREGRIAESLAICQSLWPGLQAAGDPLAMGICQHVIAINQQYAGRMKEAVLAGYAAIDKLERTPAVDRLLRSLALQAISVARLGDGGEASCLIERAMALLPHMDGRPRDQCIFWNNAGASQHVLGQLTRAAESARRASALLDQFEDPHMHSICIGNGHIYAVELACADPAALHDGRLAEAVAGIEGFLEDMIAAGRHHLLPKGGETAADGLIALGRLDAARELLRRCARLAQGAGIGPDRGVLELRLARVERLAGHYRGAASHIALALELLTEGQEQEQVAKVHLENCALHEAQQHWRAALDSFKRHAEIREALLKSQADGRAQALAARLELERSRHEAERLRLRNSELEHDMTRLTDEAGEFRRQALEDPLTGLANRRQLQLGFGQLRQQAPTQPIGLLIADIDHFKQINDGHSHAVGDAVLAELGRLLRHLSRPADVVARIGGEEFVIVFSGPLALAESLHVAERLRLAIEQHDWTTVHPGLAVTASLGLTAASPGEALDAALQRADAALYAAKRDGRNRVCSVI